MHEDLADEWRGGAGDEESLMQLVRKLRAELDEIVERHERERKSEIKSSVVRGVLAARKRRLNYFPERIFEEPAWEILLELFASELEGEPISISSACSASNAAASTSLRWFRMLEKEGLVRIKEDTKDRRRKWAQLAPRGRSALRRYFLDAPETA